MIDFRLNICLSLIFFLSVAWHGLANVMIMIAVVVGIVLLVIVWKALIEYGKTH